VIPTLPQLVERFGAHAVFLPLVVAGLFTGLVLLVQSISHWFDDRNP